MKTVLIIVALCLPVSVSAATLTWDRNSESDMKDYPIYACFTAGCTVTETAAMLQPITVLQPAVGVKPTATLDIAGKQGAVAVSARDNATPPNQSGLSVAVPFDQVAPLIPANLILQ